MSTIMRNEASDATTLVVVWSEHLRQFVWTHWVTLTPTNPYCSPLALWREFRNVFIRRLAHAARHAIPWVAALERSPGGVFHIHALIGGTEGLLDADVKELWTMGRSDAHRYDRNRGAARYLAKTLYLPDETWARYDCSREMPARYAGDSESPAATY
jgi:hypothetical protein